MPDSSSCRYRRNGKTESADFERDADGAGLRGDRNDFQLREKRCNGIVNGLVTGFADDDGFGHLAVLRDGEVNNGPGRDLASELDTGRRHSFPLGLDERIHLFIVIPHFLRAEDAVMTRVLCAGTP